MDVEKSWTHPGCWDDRPDLDASDLPNARPLEAG